MPFRIGQSAERRLRREILLRRIVVVFGMRNLGVPHVSLGVIQHIQVVAIPSVVQVGNMRNHELIMIVIVGANALVQVGVRDGDVIR